jgi:rubrerythrin
MKKVKFIEKTREEIEKWCEENKTMICSICYYGTQGSDIEPCPQCSGENGLEWGYYIEDNNGD